MTERSLMGNPATKKNGIRYKGQIQEGAAHGTGRLEQTNDQGTHVWSGTFISGKFVAGLHVLYGVGGKAEGEVIAINNKEVGTYWEKNSDGISISGFKFNNGDIYTGDHKHGTPHGKGMLTDNTLTNYSGDFFDGKRHGKGIMIWEKGDSYEGEFKNGEIAGKGKGRLTYADVSVYEGEFLDGKSHGFGVKKWPNGDFHEGEFRKNEATGKGRGRITYADGVYVGPFLNGKPHGKGEKTYLDEEVYTGDFNSGERTGDGIMKGKIDGWEYTYVGHFVKGAFDGKGEYRRSDGYIFQGKWKNDQLLEGSVSTPDGLIYKGAFNEHRLPMGECSVNAPNGMSWKGTWNNGKPDKNFVFTYTGLDGTVIKGLLDEHGNLIENVDNASIENISDTTIEVVRNEVSDAARYVKLSNLTEHYFYEGPLDNQNAFHGKGLLTLSDGTKCSGIWVQGQPQDSFYLTYSNNPNKKSYRGPVNQMCEPDCADGESGELVLIDGSKCRGPWKAGHPVGEHLIRYSNDRGEYLGPINNNGQAHGEGKITVNGVTWYGTWINGQLNGPCKQRLPNGAMLKVHLTDTYLAQGQSVIKFPNGTRCTIWWEEGKRSDIAMLTYSNGSIYQGKIDSQYEKHDTRARLTLKDGTICKGCWNHGSLEGKMKLTYLDGSIYRGEVNDQYQRHTNLGSLTLSDGTTCIALWKNDQPAEVVQLIYANNQGSYLGHINQQFQRHGKGTVSWSNSKKCQGDWENNMAVGKMVITDSQYDVTSMGTVDSAGELDGRCHIIWWKEGIEYVGNMKNGKLDGDGLLSKFGAFTYKPKFLC